MINELATKNKDSILMPSIVEAKWTELIAVLTSIITDEAKVTETGEE